MPPDDVSSFVPTDHAANIVFDGDVERCAKALAPYAPVCILAGAEQAVTLADQLSERLGLPTNGTARSEMRRNKFEMQRGIQAAGLASIPGQLTDRWDAVEAWVRENLPVVVKPVASAGTDQVFVAATLDVAKAAFEAIVGTPNTFGDLNAKVLIQRKMEGVEHNVNMVSLDGVHRVVGLWRVNKFIGAHPLYDRLVLLERDGEIQDALVAYMSKVLDALGVRVGPSHADVMWTDQGPVLIEVGVRLTGQSIQEPTEVALGGLSQVKLSLDAYLDPAGFEANAPVRYKLHKHLQRVELVSPRGGTLRALPRLDEVRGLRSFHELKLFTKPGEPIARTTDIMTVPGVVDLIHVDGAVIEEDYATLRGWERDGFYDVD